MVAVSKRLNSSLKGLNLVDSHRLPSGCGRQQIAQRCRRTPLTSLAHSPDNRCNFRRLLYRLLQGTHDIRLGVIFAAVDVL